MNCCRCGGSVIVNHFGNGVCETGLDDPVCGHWYRRARRCDWTAIVWPWSPRGEPCPGCGFDHHAIWVPTTTTPSGEEHEFHAPLGIGTNHQVIAVVRPRGGNPLGAIRVSRDFDPHNGLTDVALVEYRRARQDRLYGRVSCSR